MDPFMAVSDSFLNLSRKEPGEDSCKEPEVGSSVSGNGKMEYHVFIHYMFDGRPGVTRCIVGA
jgi:hypothetical protein